MSDMKSIQHFPMKINVIYYIKLSFRHTGAFKNILSLYLMETVQYTVLSMNFACVFNC